MIEVKHLSKNFVTRNKMVKRAVDDISFTLHQADFVAFLGPNGAGKSTTIKMLTGILTPSSGYISVNGIVPNIERRKHALQIGVVFGQRTQLWWDLPPKESFILLRKIYNIPHQMFHENMELFNQTLQLNEFIHTPVRKLSLGQRMRCELAAALLHSPKLLFLDEPTIGLDIFAKEAIREFLRVVNKQQNTTILLTTHDLEDIDNLCNSIIIIDQGKIIAEDSLNNLKMRIGDKKSMLVEIDNDTFKLPNGAKLITENHPRYQVEYNKDMTSKIMQQILDNNEVKDLAFSGTDVEQVIKRFLSNQ